MRRAESFPHATTAERTAYTGDVVSRAARKSAASHVLQLYEDESIFARAVARFAADGMLAGHGVVVIATGAHREVIRNTLAGWRLEPDHAIAAGRLVFLDAQETLDRFRDAGGFDLGRFRAVIGAVLEGCRGDNDLPPYVHGEMVDLLWRAGDAEGACRLESLWNELAVEHRFHLLCTYPMTGFGRAEHTRPYEEICGHHSHVLPSERFGDTDEDARMREVARLQQRALVLESELERRRGLERDLREALAEREQAQVAVRQREQELKECFENAVEAIHWVAADGTILWANRAELEMLGYPASEYFGRHIAEFHADQATIDDMLRRLECGETLREWEARLRHRDGSIRDVLVNSNVLWRDGRFVHTSCFTRDVTEARQAARERERLLERERQARQDAEAASRAKSEFLAIMSHELRTPLNAIGGYVELLELGLRGPLTEAQRHDLARIQKSQLHLLGLINEVLNYTRIESGAVRYDLVNVQVGEVVASVDPLVRPQLDGKGLRFSVEPCPPDAVARADREKVRQVLVNLLSNAVKFTERGGEVTVRCEIDRGGTAPLLHVHVADTGEGIPAGKLEAIFEPFTQVNARLSRPHQGAGLGLAISRDLARGMGGDLTVESRLGVGSRFTLSLPLADQA